jgi:hypothetical protein
MTLKTKVLAVRDGEEREIATGLTKAEAADLIDEMCATAEPQDTYAPRSVADLIERGVWPRGYEAVFEAENGKRWLLAP